MTLTRPPTLSVSPTSLSFTATAGGSNPANQTLSITNTGTGTFNWTASKGTATWLTVSPTSGQPNASATVSVNIAGLAAGTYSGTITITASGVAGSPLNVPATLKINAPVEALINGGFEANANPWVKFGARAFWANNGLAHSGAGYVYITGNNSTGDDTGWSQDFTLANGSVSASLTFWLGIASVRLPAGKNNTLTVEVSDATTGAVIQSLATYTHANNTNGAYVFRVVNFNLPASYSNRRIRLRFRVSTNYPLVNTGLTDFLIDDVSVKTR